MNLRSIKNKREKNVIQHITNSIVSSIGSGMKIYCRRKNKILKQLKIWRIGIHKNCRTIGE